MTLRRTRLESTERGAVGSRLAGLLVLVGATIIVVGLVSRGVLGLVSGDDGRDVLWKPQFPAGPSLMTNELAHREPELRGVRRSSDWVVTSGSLFADHGAGFSGQVDGGSPDVRSRSATGSAVLRAVSAKDHFGDVAVDLDLDVAGQTVTSRTGRNSYDGVHLMLRYGSPDSLYTVSLCRRDGTAAIKKKSPLVASDDGGYITLAQVQMPCPVQRWQPFHCEVRNTGHGVRLSLWTLGRRVLSVRDAGSGGAPPLIAPGRIGVRGDNTEFRFRDLVVRRLT